MGRTACTRRESSTRGIVTGEVFIVPQARVGVLVLESWERGQIHGGSPSRCHREAMNSWPNMNLGCSPERVRLYLGSRDQAIGSQGRIAEWAGTPRSRRGWDGNETEKLNPRLLYQSKERRRRDWDGARMVGPGHRGSGPRRARRVGRRQLLHDAEH